MLLMTKIIFENVISIDVAKGIALLLRLILQGNGLIESGRKVTKQ